MPGVSASPSSSGDVILRIPEPDVPESTATTTGNGSSSRSTEEGYEETETEADDSLMTVEAATAFNTSYSEGLKRYDFLFKVLLVGDSEVGKTSLLKRLTDDQFEANFLTTIVIDFKMKIFRIGEKNVKLQVWDCSGLKQYAQLRENFYRGSLGAIFCFDVTNRQSFIHLQEWIKEVNDQVTATPYLKVIVGCKTDLEHLHAVGREEAQTLAICQGAKYIETSSLLDQNVHEPFLHLATSLLAVQEGWEPDRRLLRPESAPNQLLQRTSVRLRSISRRVSSKSLRKSFRRSVSVRIPRRRRRSEGDRPETGEVEMAPMAGAGAGAGERDINAAGDDVGNEGGEGEGADGKKKRRRRKKKRKEKKEKKEKENAQGDHKNKLPRLSKAACCVIS